MARPPLALGTHGSISVKQREGRSSYVARCRFRDLDGVTRHLEYAGRSKTAAHVALQDALKTRMGSPVAPLRPEHKFERAAEMWLASSTRRWLRELAPQRRPTPTGSGSGR
jgi:hypothetical protein